MQQHPLREDRRSRASFVVAFLTAVATMAIGLTASAPAQAADQLLSQGKSVTASSVENADYTPASAAVDGNNGTRWASMASDPQWIQVDLGQRADIMRVDLRWESAFGKNFTIAVSDDAINWSTVATGTNGTGGNQSVNSAGTGRYVKLTGTARGTGYGYSLWELQVFGSPSTGDDGDNGGGENGGICEASNIAQGHLATASSAENGGSLTAAAALAVDGKTNTRWASTFSDAQWWQVDLGASRSICKVSLQWEAAYGKAFGVQVSANATGPWTEIATVTNGKGGAQVVDVAGQGRYLRLDLRQRATGYGYSLWEVAVFGGSGGTTPPVDPPVDPIPGGGSLGENVHIFTPSTGDGAIQNKLNEVFAAQETAQFGTRRDQFLFAPGSYNVHAPIGFNTSISGLGKNPDDVNINGGVWVDADWFDGNATQNFWRSAENFAVTPSTGENRWAVSQAAPFRRIHVKGALSLAPSSYGWASGGFIADSKIDGAVRSYSQQQWYSRDSTFGSWEGSVWNMVFSGVAGSPAPSFPNPSHTVLDTTPISREKPYLYLNGSNIATDLAVFVPSTRQNARGASWANGSTPGTSIPLSQFYVAKPGDTALRINQALAQGLNLLFTPGIYNLDQTIQVNRPNTVVLGLGYATITPTAGQTALKVADVDGVKIASILFDAGVVNSPALLEVGTTGTHASHAANPSSVHDVFFRIGGRIPGKVTDALVVNADSTIIDHIWSWRADHGAGHGWTVNTADHGLVVNGNDVEGLGLFVEHYQKENVIWNGERGRTIFYQNELPYDVPNQAAWQNGTRRGYAGYRVADAVNNHEAWGLGVYSFFNVDPTIVVDSGFQVPTKPGVKLHNLLTVSLGGNGIIQHVVNNTGGIAQGTDTIPAYLTGYSG